jgi:hypothetical protein
MPLAPVGATPRKAAGAPSAARNIDAADVPAVHAAHDHATDPEELTMTGAFDPEIRAAAAIVLGGERFEEVVLLLDDAIQAKLDFYGYVSTGTLSEGLGEVALELGQPGSGLVDAIDAIAEDDQAVDVLLSGLNGIIDAKGRGEFAPLRLRHSELADVLRTALRAIVG